MIKKEMRVERTWIMSIIGFNIAALGKPVQIPLWYMVITTQVHVNPISLASILSTMDGCRCHHCLIHSISLTHSTLYFQPTLAHIHTYIHPCIHICLYLYINLFCFLLALSYTYYILLYLHFHANTAGTFWQTGIFLYAYRCRRI